MSENEDERIYGEHSAAIYDDFNAAKFDPGVVTSIVDVLERLATDGTALEFGIGTGRVALPLARRGVRVSGIDASDAMVARMRAKPGGGEIDVTVEDFATTCVGGRFSLVYAVFNTIFHLTTQDEQVAAFENAAAQINAGGHFVVEADVPRLQGLPPDETVKLVDPDRRMFSLNVHDATAQTVTTQEFVARDGKIISYCVEIRYAPPSELDLMARVAGLTLLERWGGWKGEPFTGLTTSHVSIYRKP